MTARPGSAAHVRAPALAAGQLVARLVEEVQDYAILLLDVDGRVASWNAGARRFKGYEADEIIGRHFSVFYPPEAIAAKLPERLLATARAEGRAEDEGWRLRKDGARFWASVVITGLRDETGALLGYGKVTRDLTERHRAELARQAAEERFEAAFTHAPIGISISDLRHGRDGCFIDVNPALARMLGYERDELVGRRVTDVTHPGDREPGGQLLSGLLGGRSVSVEMRLVHREGHALWALVSSTPQPEPGGEAPRWAISQILDISERRQFESRLRHLADHDALTGLYNRHRFETELERVISETTRDAGHAALLVTDLDGFKEVNDRFGHPVGDQLVRRIGELLRDTVRAGDVVARLGGDEFAVIAPEADPHDAEQLADRILAAIRDAGRVVHEFGQAHVTASIGITAFSAESGLSGAELVVEADMAMYDAKAQGRDRRVRYDRHAQRTPVSRRGLPSPA